MNEFDKVQPPPPFFRTDPSASPDRAVEEERALQSEIEKLSSRHRRSGMMRGVIADGMRCTMRSVFASMIAAILVVAVHRLTPWNWLSEERLRDLRAFLFSGAVIGAVTTQMQ